MGAALKGLKRSSPPATPARSARAPTHRQTQASQVRRSKSATWGHTITPANKKPETPPLLNLLALTSAKNLPRGPAHEMPPEKKRETPSFRSTFTALRPQEERRLFRIVACFFSCAHPSRLICTRLPGTGLFLPEKNKNPCWKRQFYCRKTDPTLTSPVDNPPPPPRKRGWRGKATLLLSCKTDPPAKFQVACSHHAMWGQCFF